MRAGRAEPRLQAAARRRARAVPITGIRARTECSPPHRIYGQVGAAGDNAAMESFFALLQKHVLDRRRWRTRKELRIALITWIELTYHRRRRQARLAPIEYEAIMSPAVDLAA